MKEIACEQLCLNPELFPFPAASARAEGELNEMFIDIPTCLSGIVSEHLGNPQRTLQDLITSKKKRF